MNSDIFNAKGGMNGAEAVLPIIKKCVAMYPDQVHYCYNIFSCILDNVSSEIPARWSAAASVLAFIPTLMGLISNSLEELVLFSYHSPILAVLLCLSSTTAFSTRLDFRSSSAHLASFENNSQRIQHHIHQLFEVLANSKEEKQRNQRAYSENILAFCFGATLVGLVAAVWYKTIDITIYGIVVFACPIKSNVPLYVSLSQLLSLLSVLLRNYSYASRQIHIPQSSCQNRRATLGAANLILALNTRLFQLRMGARPRESCCRRNCKCDCIVMILLAERLTMTRIILQAASAILSYGLLTYGTVIFASINMYSTSDAVRAMVIMTISAIFGRLVGSWIMQSSRTGRRVIIVDVPIAQLDQLAYQVELRAHA
jgi:hypothetical protein